MPNPAKKSLVEVLADYADEFCLTPRDGRHGVLVKAANLAEPYEARRLALEKVAQAAHLFAMTGESMDGDELKRYLSAVPPLPEEQDGS